MSDDPFAGRKLFTVEQANTTLPLVRAIVTDMAQLSRELIERQFRVKALLAAHEGKHRDVYIDELSQIEEELTRDGERLQGYIEELNNLGVEAKNGPEGIVDFPAVMEGRPVYLCWKLGEPEVLHWHDLDAGFAGRQQLVAGSGAGGQLGENSLGC
jgi:hypothetical protein